MTDIEKSKIFANVIFEFDRILTGTRRAALQNILLEHGAKAFENEKRHGHADHATHYITNRNKKYVSAQYQVTPNWVTAAVRNGFVHEPQYYYPDPTKFFSGIVVTTFGIPERDREAIFGATMALGGQYREGLSSDVTHLVCLAPEGDVYEQALKIQNDGHLKIVLPHWFDECFKLRRLVREDIFLFPDPLYLHPPATTTTTTEMAASKLSSSNNSSVRENNEYAATELTRSDSNISAETNQTNVPKTITLDTKDKSSHLGDSPQVHPLPKMEQLEQMTPMEKLFEGDSIYLHSDIGISPEFRTCLVQQLEKAGATIKQDYDELDDSQGSAAIAIFKHRNSDLFMQACKEGKTVASMMWLTNSLRRGRIESPLRTLWDFPSPRGGIPGMENMMVTVTGYEAEARTLIFQLCTMVGLRWTPNLESNTTHLICSKRGSAKYKVGRLRNCNIVNHIWLEECYQQWECKSVADERYTYFPSNDILQNLVGKTPLLPTELERWYDKLTWPAMTPYIPAYMLCKSTNVLSSGSESPVLLGARRPRKAALDANSQLHDVMIPDMNKYQEEEKRTNTGSSTGRTKQKRVSSDLSSPPVKRAKTSDQRSESPPISVSMQSVLPSETKKRQKRPSFEEDESTTDDDDEGMNKQVEQQVSSQENITQGFSSRISSIATTNVELSNDEVKAIRKLGSKIVNDIRQANILIVPNRILRTPKFLCAVNLGIDIVNTQWLKDSIEKQAWCNPMDYQVDDKEAEEKYGFRLEASLHSARQAIRSNINKKKNGIWLEGYDVCLVQTGSSVLKEVVETAGGNIIPIPKTKDKHDKVLALANKDNRRKKVWDQLRQNGIKIYDQELVIVGSLRQQLALDEFILLKNKK
ncbi:BRCT domain-containing protein [Halteromyces radiatus]|uniref:BRCT domain-containing protein n=1 Tax=Halteromyces radiatus TaxID=101107 RepID=UPI002220028D|nr:BRCT domain-containing protein [Halteromyces radiatus]KAI8099113.1 BRCT domain-containing protein [Halteromyces radiatus]